MDIRSGALFCSSLCVFLWSGAYAQQSLVGESWLYDLDAQSRCGVRLDTLEEYEDVWYGPAAIRSDPGTAHERICEKISMDAKVAYCHIVSALDASLGLSRWHLEPARDMDNDGQSDFGGVPEFVAQSMREQPYHVGGEEAWQQNVDNAWFLVDRAIARYRLKEQKLDYAVPEFEREIQQKVDIGCPEPGLVGSLRLGGALKDGPVAVQELLNGRTRLDIE